MGYFHSDPHTHLGGLSTCESPHHDSNLNPRTIRKAIIRWFKSMWLDILFLCIAAAYGYIVRSSPASFHSKLLPPTQPSTSQLISSVDLPPQNPLRNPPLPRYLPQLRLRQRQPHRLPLPSIPSTHRTLPNILHNPRFLRHPNPRPLRSPALDSQLLGLEQRCSWTSLCGDWGELLSGYHQDVYWRAEATLLGCLSAGYSE